MSSPVIATMSAQPGPQTDFLRSSADICIYGGAAGGGKTVGLILEPLRYVRRVTNFTAVFFRRMTPQITNPGGLWDDNAAATGSSTWCVGAPTAAISKDCCSRPRRR